MSGDPHGPGCVCGECLLRPPPNPRQHYSGPGRLKIGHPGEWQAKRRARWIMRDGASKMRPGNTELRAYQCEICHLWHVGQA